MDTLKLNELRCNSAGKVVAKIKTKSKIHSFRNGNGTLFSMDIEDDLGDRIRMVFFNDLASKHEDTIEVSNSTLISIDA